MGLGRSGRRPDRQRRDRELGVRPGQVIRRGAARRARRREARTHHPRPHGGRRGPRHRPASLAGRPRPLRRAGLGGVGQAEAAGRLQEAARRAEGPEPRHGRGRDLPALM